MYQSIITTGKITATALGDASLFSARFQRSKAIQSGLTQNEDS